MFRIMNRSPSSSSPIPGNTRNVASKSVSSTSSSPDRGRELKRNPSRGRLINSSPIRAPINGKGKSSTSNAPQRITNYPLHLILEDKLAFSHFMMFAEEFHSCENLFFWCTTVAFREMGNPEGWHRTMPRTPSFTMQEALDTKEGQWRDASVEQVKLLREAYGVYDRFIPQDAPAWVCLPPDMVSKIEKQLDSARLAKKGKMPNISFKLFEDAEKYTFHNLVHDILPRYLMHLSKSGNSVMTSYLKNLLREKCDSSSVKMSTNDQVAASLSSSAIENALASLYPSPRACIENRPGSKLYELVPRDLLAFDPKDQIDTEILLDTTKKTSSGRWLPFFKPRTRSSSNDLNRRSAPVRKVSKTLDPVPFDDELESVENPNSSALNIRSRTRSKSNT